MTSPCGVIRFQILILLAGAFLLFAAGLSSAGASPAYSTDIPSFNERVSTLLTVRRPCGVYPNEQTPCDCQAVFRLAGPPVVKTGPRRDLGLPPQSRAPQLIVLTSIGDGTWGAHVELDRLRTPADRILFTNRFRL